MTQQTSEQALLERIEDLEAKFTFQEDAIEALNKALVTQQLDIQKLKQVIENLHSQMQQMGDNTSQKQQDETPPHY